MRPQDKQDSKQTLFEQTLEAVRRKNDQRTATKQADFLIKRAAVKRISPWWIVLPIIAIVLVIAVFKLAHLVPGTGGDPTATAGSPTPPPLVEVEVRFTQEGPIVIKNSEQRLVQLEFKVLEGQKPPQETRNVVFCSQANDFAGSVGNCSESVTVSTNAAGIAVYDFSLRPENGDITVRGQLAEDSALFDTIQIQIRRKSPNLTFTDVSVDPDPTSVDLKQGDQFSIVFDIQNTGEADAANVQLKVQIPAGTEYIGEECAATDDGNVLCEVGNLTINNNSPNRVPVKLRATAPGMVTLQPEMYSVSYGGNANAVITGSEPVALTFGELQPFRIELQAAEERVLADGQSTVELIAIVYGENGEPIERPTNVSFSIQTPINEGDQITPLGSVTPEKATTETAPEQMGVAKSSFTAGAELGVVEIMARVDSDQVIESEAKSITLIKEGVVSGTQRNLYPDSNDINMVLISYLPPNTSVMVIREETNSNGDPYYWVELSVWAPRAALSIDGEKGAIVEDGWIVEIGETMPQTEPERQAIVPEKVKERQISTPAKGREVRVLEDDGDSEFVPVVILGWMPASAVTLSP